MPTLIHCAAAIPLLVLLLGGATASAQNVEKILSNGPDADKLRIAIVGDGFTEAEMPEYVQRVKDVVLDGVFLQDAVFHKNHTAFNVYRIDAVSAESGVTQIQYNENGTSSDKSDDTIQTCSADADCNGRNVCSAGQCRIERDTALHYRYSGSWSHCWMERSSNTNALLQAILDSSGVDPEYVVVILNETGGGGCGGGGRVVVTRAGGYSTLAHEFGHGVGTLFDEYTRARPYAGNPVNSKNCSTELDAAAVAWSDLLDPAATLPTTFDASTMDPVSSAGMFEGCKTYNSGIYRPVNNCRMKSSGNQFCPVCGRYISELLEPYHNDTYLASFNYPGAACSGVGGAKPLYTSRAIAQNNTAAGISLLCPARRHRNEAGAWSSYVFGVAWVVDRHPTENVCCQIRTKNPAGAGVAGVEVCTAGSSSSYQTLTVSYPKVNDPYTFSHYYMSCSVPPVNGSAASSVHTYRIYEQRF